METKMRGSGEVHSIVRYVPDMVRDANTNIHQLTVASFVCKKGYKKQEARIRSGSGNKQER
jgi:hypothetical protein